MTKNMQKNDQAGLVLCVIIATRPGYFVLRRVGQDNGGVQEMWDSCGGI